MDGNAFASAMKAYVAAMIIFAILAWESLKWLLVFAWHHIRIVH